MKANLELENLITRKLRARSLIRVPGELAFSHRGQAVSLEIDESIYRGYFITVLDGTRKVREFREVQGDFDWDGVTRSIIEVADARFAPKGAGAAAQAAAASNRQLAIDLTKMVANGATPHLSIEPSPASPGRLRVKLQELDLDPITVMQLCATLSRALGPAKDKSSVATQFAVA